MFGLFALTLLAVPAQPIALVQLAAPSGIPVPWSFDNGRCTFYVGCGPIDFRNERGELRRSDHTYFYAWFWHYQDHAFTFEILEKINGTPPEICLADLNQDGTDEIILKNVDGAHTHKWHIYGRVGATRELSKLGVIVGDFGDCRITDTKRGGYLVIEAFDHNLSDRSRKDRLIFSMHDGHYQQESSGAPDR